MCLSKAKKIGADAVKMCVGWRDVALGEKESDGREMQDVERVKVERG